MPRLVHRPPAYRRHKSTNQAVVSLFGDRIYLGPYGSPRSHERYQELLKKWEKHRHREVNAEAGEELPPITSAAKAKPVITPAKLRAKRMLGQPIAISEVIYVYRLHTHSYYQKNGEVTREAGIIDDALRILRKHYGNSQAAGPHRLFQWHEDLEQIGKSSVTMGPLEIRLGADGKGAQSLLPPSETDGWGRQWGVSLEECPPAELPKEVLEKILAAFGKGRLLNCAGEGVEHSTQGVGGGDGEVEHSNVEHSMKHSNAVFHIANDTPTAVFHFQHDHTDAVSHSLKYPPASDNDTNQFSKPVHRAIKRAIDNTMPGSEGFRNKLLLQLARQLKGIPALTNLPPEELESIVLEWHRQALPAIATKDFATTWYDFVVAWGNVKYPVSEGPLAEIYQAGLSKMPVVASKYKVEGVRKLIALCRELQLRAGERPFWLACRPAAAVLKTAPTSAHRWIWKLIHSNVLELVNEGSRGRAAEYWYLGD